MAFIYATAVTLNGFLADAEHSLEWLNAISSEGTAPNTFAYSALVMGSHTYEWLLRYENLLAQPEKWQHYFGTRPVFVFSSRALPRPQGADIRLLQGEVAQHLPTIGAEAAGGNVWIQGGGDLAGQFLAAGALDEIILDVAPVALASGAPLLPLTVLWPRLKLLEARPNGEFAHLHWQVDSAALEESPATTLPEVRRQIDALDEQLLDVLAQRQKLVEQAGRLKPKGDRQAVAAPERVAQVIAARWASAQARGLSPEVAEAVWRAMIEAFTRLEMGVNAAAPVVTHITTRQAWAEAMQVGEYRASSLEKQGFIHCSDPTQGQLLAVANALYRGQSGLILLVIDVSKLTSPLRYEEYEKGSQHFPHLYGPLNLEAVQQVLDFRPGLDGYFELPAELL